jgi:hypothetical protein
MSQHNYGELVAFALAESAKPFIEAVAFVRVLDFDIHKTRWPPDTLAAFQFQEDCKRWGVEHAAAKIPNDAQPGNMKVQVYALNMTPKGISPWLDLEQIPAWKLGKISE